jgi:hypothetical protein
MGRPGLKLPDTARAASETQATAEGWATPTAMSPAAPEIIHVILRQPTFWTRHQSRTPGRRP